MRSVHWDDSVGEGGRRDTVGPGLAGADNSHVTIATHQHAGSQTVASGNAIRGSRVGAGPMGEAERGESAPRLRISFWCANGHETRPSFASDAQIPDTWDCPRCGFPAGQDEENPPAPPRTEPYKTHLAYVRERRSDADGEAILAEALAKLRGEI